MSDVRTFTAHRWGPDEDYLQSWEIREWSIEHDRILADMVAAGMASGSMAKKLNRTKNSIIGRCHRLGLQLAGKPHGDKSAPAKPAAHYQATKPAHRARVAPPAPKPRKPPVAAPAPPVEPPSPALTRTVPEQLPPAAAIPGVPQPAAFPAVRSCQFPVSEDRPWRFCGAAVVVGRSYCLAHERICWQVPPRQRSEAAA